MLRRLVIALVTLAAVVVVVVPDALAKGPVTSLQVCGADGCASTVVPLRLKGPLGLEQLMGPPDVLPARHRPRRRFIG